MTPQEVLRFWFGESDFASMQKWFMGGPAFDAEIKAKFGATIDAAVAGELDHWVDTPEGLTALVIVLDQFTRNVYRKDPRAFAGDERAQHWAHEAFLHRDAAHWPLVHRYFTAMPFMHAENVDLQHFGEPIFAGIGAEPKLDGIPGFARDHRVIVERFGRFPDRNHLLGRPTTDEERAFMHEAKHPWFERGWETS
ncbi:MAG: DUF924 family protein [Thermoplasmatota archaeon]